MPIFRIVDSIVGASKPSAARSDGLLGFGGSYRLIRSSVVPPGFGEQLAPRTTSCHSVHLACAMDKTFPKSFEYILDFLSHLSPDAKVDQRPGFTFFLDIQGERTVLSFDQDELEDFEVALDRFRDSSYFHTLENRIRFRVLIALGSKGLVPNVKISSELLGERGEWLKSVRTDVAFSKDFCEVLQHGLRLLSASMTRILDAGVRMPEVEAERRRVDDLVNYYEANGHLTSSGAELESLSYLKAAAVCAIIEKEKIKEESPIPRIKKAIDAEIYSIVSKIRSDPFRDIKLPAAMYDYVAQQGLQVTTKTPTYVRDVPQTPEQTKLDALLEKLDPRLRRRREGAWQALSSENPDRLSQAANSMVELLDQVISQTCRGTDLASYLATKYQTHQKTEWVDATRQWIGRTKDNLHSTKHHVEHQSEHLTKVLLATAESIMLVVLE